MLTSPENLKKIDGRIARLAVAYEDGDPELIEVAENDALQAVKKAAWELETS